jgi:hypothetical protein
MRRLLIALLVFVQSFLAAPAQESPRTPHPRAVVEMFTSQGCSACPAADRLLGEIARDPTIIALSYSVQIWDHLGWRDTLATPENTARQKAYSEARGDRRVYTPQAVINGVFHAIGSSRSEIEARYVAAASGPAAAALSVPVTIEREGARVKVSLGARGDVGAARILIVTFERERRVVIARGENKGHTLTYFNAVRSFMDRGGWTGAAMSIGFDLPNDAGLGAAVLLQAVDNAGAPGVILGAAQTR